MRVRSGHSLSQPLTSEGLIALIPQLAKSDFTQELFLVTPTACPLNNNGVNILLFVPETSVVSPPITPEGAVLEND